MRSPAAAVLVVLCSSGFCVAQSPTWTTKTPMPTPRSALAVGVVDGIVYAVGGVNNTGVLSTVEAYNPATGYWSAKLHADAAVRPVRRSG